MKLIADTYYIEKIQAGETDGFAVLMERYSRPVFNLILKMTENREDAEELTQDVFLKAFRSLGSFQGESRFSTWLYRIAYNTAVSATRKRRQEWLSIDEAMIENVSEEDVSDELEQVSKEEQLERLEQALAQLPPDERALMLLFYMQEKTVEEIVLITRLSAPNVKTKLHRIRKKLFVLMEAMER
jgi:RNA polymerase sigma-70 factor (ECF subfamily)